MLHTYIHTSTTGSQCQMGPRELAKCVVQYFMLCKYKHFMNEYNYKYNVLYVIHI